MKPDGYMPLWGNDLWQATEGYSETVTLAYIRCLWHYWNHTHTSGLPDDDEYLRRLCRCDIAAWARTKPIIFGELFRLDNGKWHQKRARDAYRYSSKAYDAKVGAASKARQAKSVANVDNNPDNRAVVNPHNMDNHNHISTKYSNTGKPFPTLEEVKAKCPFIGLDEAEGQRFFDYYQSTGWIDRNGNPVVDWQARLAMWASRKREDKGKPLAGQSRAPTVHELRAVLAAKEALAVDLLNGHSTVAAGDTRHWDTDKSRNDYRTLRREIKDLLSRLSKMG